MKKNVYGKFIVTVALAWLVCFVLLAIFYMLLLRPQNQKRFAIEQKLAQAQQLCNAAEAATQEKAREELNRQLDKLRDKIRDYVVDEKDCADLTFAISKIANEKNVSEFNIRSADNPVLPGNNNFKYIYEKHIDVDFTSGFNQFAGFLNALERYQPVIFVDDFKMTREKDNPSGHKFNMGLVVLVRKRPG